MNFRIGQDVRVYPLTWCLRRYNGWRGQVDTIEVEDDARGNPVWIYRVKLTDEPGQGFPYYAHELKGLDAPATNAPPKAEHNRVSAEGSPPS
jgi:hypothetical protein